MSDQESQVDSVRIKQNKGVYLTWSAIVFIASFLIGVGGSISMYNDSLVELDILKRRQDKQYDRLEDKVKENSKNDEAARKEMLDLMIKVNTRLIDSEKEEAYQKGFQEGWQEGRKDMMDIVKFTHYSEKR